MRTHETKDPDEVLKEAGLHPDQEAPPTPPAHSPLTFADTVPAEQEVAAEEPVTHGQPDGVYGNTLVVNQVGYDLSDNVGNIVFFEDKKGGHCFLKDRNGHLKGEPLPIYSAAHFNSIVNGVVGYLRSIGACVE